MIIHGFGAREESLETQLKLQGVSSFFIPKTRQIHSDIVMRMTSRVSDLVVEADAFVTTEPGVVCAVRTADCVPVLMWDAHERVIAAVHAGWRGVASEIVVRTVEEMREQFSDLDLRIAMGPAMAASCYEVGEEVVVNCGKTVSDVVAYLQPTRPGHHCINLKGIITEQLNRIGIPPNCIEDLPLCTHCDTRYASFRRGDRLDRQYSWIVITF
jgi:YfiH family protein